MSDHPSPKDLLNGTEICGKNERHFEKAMLMMLTMLIAMYYGILNQLGNLNGHAVSSLMR